MVEKSFLRIDSVPDVDQTLRGSNSGGSRSAALATQYWMGLYTDSGTATGLTMVVIEEELNPQI